MCSLQRFREYIASTVIATDPNDGHSSMGVLNEVKSEKRASPNVDIVNSLRELDNKSCKIIKQNEVKPHIAIESDHSSEGFEIFDS